MKLCLLSKYLHLDTYVKQDLCTTIICLSHEMSRALKDFTTRIFRRKKFTVNDHGEIVDNYQGPKLLRVLGLYDLTFLGIGSTLGVGIYVLAGSVAKDIAGPAVCLSFLIAAVASGISGWSLFFIQVIHYNFYYSYVYRVVLCRVWCTNTKSWISLYLQLCYSWRTGGLYHWMEPDFRIFNWYLVL